MKMTGRRASLVFAVAALCAQTAVIVPEVIRHGTKPRDKAEEYSVTTPILGGRAVAAADFMGHTIGGRRTTFLAEDYIVIEVAVYPNRGQIIPVSPGDFVLRVNGKKLFAPQAPEFVAAALKYQWSSKQRQLEMSGGVGGADVIFGRPTQTQRFPGDGSESRLPPQPKTTSGDGPTEVPQTASDAALEGALPGYETKAPISGYVYFPYEGKLKSLHSLELLLNEKSGAQPILKIR